MNNYIKLWNSWYLVIKKQTTCVTTSTAESEYVDLAKCVPELKWIIWGGRN